MKTYNVILVDPDYVSTSYPEDGACVEVEAESIAEAVEQAKTQRARQLARQAAGIKKDDLLVLWVLEGKAEVVQNPLGPCSDDEQEEEQSE